MDCLSVSQQRLIHLIGVSKYLCLLSDTMVLVPARSFLACISAAEKPGSN